MSSPSDIPEEVSIQREPDPQTPEPLDERSPWTPAYSEYVEKLNSFPTPEEKIAFGLNFMRESISQEGSPRFREFWESRRLVLPFFRENINPAIRSRLWGEYVDLTVEARRLKEILEEQSAFAMEQIDLAINAIEGDLSNFASLLAQYGEIDFPEAAQEIQQKAQIYNQIQRELNLLNTLASRLNSLRKEIIKTDMRIRFKTKFFKRLSTLGDQIFPKRKELIEQISSEFSMDVEHFAAKHFQGSEVVGAPYYALREEIKALQGMAKILTLNSSVFSRTRLLLSECWDKLKVLEKEHKKVVSERRQASSEARQPIQSKIDELKTRAEGLSLRDLDREIDTIAREMRAVSLDRDDVRVLRDELANLRAPHAALLEQKSRELEEAEKNKIRWKKEKLVQIKEQITHVMKEGHQMDLEALSAQFEQLAQEIGSLEASKMEKQQLERQLRSLKNLLAEKKEHSLINLSDDDRKTLENLRLVLAQKKVRRQEIKDHLETNRKALGASNLDFEKAMLFRELVEQEKELLEKANAGIAEIEQKISDLEG
jgi:DNA repair exonuclease SbcCD ATPase subunit